MNNILKLKDVNIGYNTPSGVVKAVRDANLDIAEGDSLGIVGESGSGKSTLAMGILRLLPKTAVFSGEAIFNNSQNLFALDKKELDKLRWKEIAVVFQKSMNSFSPVHKIGDQIADIYKVHEPKASKEEIYKIMKELFTIVNLNDRVLDLYPHQLSGGMLQRICISLSLIHRPKIVFFDEATTALDVVTQGQVLTEIKRLQSTYSVTSILITHDMSVVAETCNKVSVMYAGYILETGAVKDVMSNPFHPYTQGLISSFPKLKGERKPLVGIPGSLPDLKQDYDGCIFAPRCAVAMDICHKARPKTVEKAPGHFVSCHRCSEVQQ